MGSFGAFDITHLAKMLRDIDPDRDSDSDNDNNGVNNGSLATSSKFQTGPGQIAAASLANAAGSKSQVNNAAAAAKVNNGKKTIWSESEVEAKGTLCNNAGPLGNDPRKVPEYEMHFRQSVTTEDIFLQMGNKTPGTSSCEALVVQISLPGENHHLIQLDLQNLSIQLRSPTYLLFLPLPQPVDPKAGNAKWDQSKEKLIITLVLARELDMLNF